MRICTRRHTIRLLLFAMALAFGGRLSAQQMYSFSQYMFNNFLVNPAVAGTYNYYQIRVNSRFQWVGLREAPIVNAVSVFGPHAKQPMGFGGSFYYDMTGPTSRAGLLASYAYNFRLNDEMRISAGLSLGFMAYILDASKFDLGDNQTPAVDPALLEYNTKSFFTPDATLGVYVYATFFYVGLSVHQLFFYPQKTRANDLKMNRLEPHIYLNAGYLVFFYDYLEFEPAVILKYTYPWPFQFDVSAKLTYNNMVWVGLSYRFQDAVGVMAGYKYQNRLLIGYSFDFSYTNLWRHSGGTHEIVFGYQFDKIK